MQQDYWTTSLVEKLRALRLQTSTSIEMVAQRCGVSPETVSAWEQSPTPSLTLANSVDYALACGYVPMLRWMQEKKAS